MWRINFMKRKKDKDETIFAHAHAHYRITRMAEMSLATKDVNNFINFKTASLSLSPSLSRFLSSIFLFLPSFFFSFFPFFLLQETFIHSIVIKTRSLFNLVMICSTTTSSFHSDFTKKTVD